MKIPETIIFPTVTHGSESWTVRNKKKNDAFELWTWRRILRQENEHFSFGGSATQKTIRSNNPFIHSFIYLRSVNPYKVN